MPDYIDMAAIAADLDVQLNTVHVMNKRATRNRAADQPRPGDLPPPDATFGRSPVWLRSTYEEWKRQRPGRGAGGGRPGKPR